MILFSGIDIVILKNDIDAEEEADILSGEGTKASVVSNCLPYWLYKTSLNWAIQNPLRWEQNFG